MADSREIKNALFAHFADGWPRADGAPQVPSQPEHFSPPLVAENEDVKNLAWDEFVRFTVRHFDSQQRTIGAVGNRSFRRDAMVVIQVFVRKGKRTSRLDEIANLARLLFEGRQINGANFSAVQIDEIGLDSNEDNAYYQFNVEAPFYYIERL